MVFMIIDICCALRLQVLLAMAEQQGAEHVMLIGDQVYERFHMASTGPMEA